MIMSSDVIFSEAILSKLNSLFADGRCPHALLIDGGTDVQRQNLARFTAKMMVCSNIENAPCGVCENCRKAEESIHPDIITVTKPDDKKFYAKAGVKKVVADAYLTPNEAVRKVYILSELQLMNEECQNLLLKILEEPPVYTAFVLTSQTANAVIGTVLSRVSRLHLGNNGFSEYSAKAIGVVSDIAVAIGSPYEYEKIKATAPLDNNKALTVEVIGLLVAVLRDAIALKSGGKILLSELEKQSTELSGKCNLKKLMDMYDAVCVLHRSLENNPNNNLLLAVLCARL